MEIGFFGCGEEWYHFQQELMVSKMIFQVFRQLNFYSFAIDL